MAENKDKFELKDEELTSVQGGSFYDRGHTWSSDGDHQMIVTALYTCSLWRSTGNHHKKSEDSTPALCVCSICMYCERSGIVLYCKKRTYSDDPLENNKWSTSGRF